MFDKSRASRFKKVRKFLRFNQIQMAEALNVSQTLISLIENGLSDISSEMYHILFTRYKISIVYLNAGVGTMEVGKEQGQKQLLNLIKEMYADVDYLKSEVLLLKMERDNRLKIVK